MAQFDSHSFESSHEPVLTLSSIFGLLSLAIMRIWVGLLKNLPSLDRHGISFLKTRHSRGRRIMS